MFPGARGEGTTSDDARARGCCLPRAQDPHGGLSGFLVVLELSPMCPSSLLLMGDASRASREVAHGLVMLCARARAPRPCEHRPRELGLAGEHSCPEVPRAPCGSACTGSEPLRGADCVSRVSLTPPGPPGPHTPAHG